MANYLETAAAYAWDQLPDAERVAQEVSEFSEAVEKASADAEARMVAVIMKAAPVSWQEAAWCLERSHRPFRRRERVEPPGGGGGPVKVEVYRQLEA